MPRNSFPKAEARPIPGRAHWRITLEVTDMFAGTKYELTEASIKTLFKDSMCGYDPRVGAVGLLWLARLERLDSPAQLEANEGVRRAAAASDARAAKSRPPTRKEAARKAVKPKRKIIKK